jgi:outer membrane protein assembly factor BamE (lipoprotein component of BamABCDE complex)
MRRVFLLLAAALVFASAAGATIVPQKGIAGVRIGMSKAKVRSVLGRPTSVKHGSNDFGRYTIFKYSGLKVNFQGNATVTGISTTRRAERTARGVGVGSSEAQVKAKVTGVKCRTDAGFRHCYVGSLGAGQRVTDFSIKNGRVSRVDVGVVID